jgi:hypothetical protein
MPYDRLVHHFLSVYAEQQGEGIWSLKEPMVSMASSSHPAYLDDVDTNGLWSALYNPYLPFMTSMMGRVCLFGHDNQRS